MRLAAAVLAVVVSACVSASTGGQVWYKENGSPEERDRLLAAAQVQAQQASQTAHPGSPDTPESHQRLEHESVVNYMMTNGWHLVPRSEAKPLRPHRASGSSTGPLTGPAALDR
jgi:poly(3-hydroxybutyrate) depolymerase